jgi:hypothetical protein
MMNFLSNQFSSTSHVNGQEHAKKALYNICLVLDISNSMRERFTEVIVSINKFIQVQQDEQKNNTVTFTLLLFGQNIKYHLKNINLKDVRPLDHKSFVLETSTSLYDAIGKCAEDFADKNNVILCIVTDGQDNSSKRYNKHTIKSIIDTKQKYNNWSAIYLSAHIQGFNDGVQLSAQNNIQSTGKTMGYDIANTMNSMVSQIQQVQKPTNYNAGFSTGFSTGFRTGLSSDFGGYKKSYINPGMYC